MNKFKYISTTLPYANSIPHIGHTFEFVIADIIARFYRHKGYTVLFNTGLDEHGIKIQQAAQKEGVAPDIFCWTLSELWKTFCKKYQISYDNFYRTSDERHKIGVKKIFEEYFKDEQYIFKKKYIGKYCIGCESFITEKEIIDNKCPIHKTELKELEEENLFFNLEYLKHNVTDILVNKSLSKELKNICNDFDEISITRQGIDWGIKINETETLYVWFEALLSYCLSAGFEDIPNDFKEFWESSLIICGKDNLKFQAYILQAINFALGISQNKEILVHGMILDEKGVKMSKTLGNVIDPIDQLEKFGVSPVRYYLFFGLNIFEDSCYSEDNLIDLWNSDIVNGFGNLVARVLHLIDIKKIKISYNEISNGWDHQLQNWQIELNQSFTTYNFHRLRINLNFYISGLNTTINTEKPFDKNCENAEEILNELYYGIKVISEYYKIILPEFSDKIENCLSSKKKEILFKRIEINEKV